MTTMCTRIAAPLVAALFLLAGVAHAKAPIQLKAGTGVGPGVAHVRARGRPVVVAATGIGLFLPPIGVGFFIACGIAKVSADRASSAMMPSILMMCLGLVIVILVPWVTLVVPALLKLN